VCCVCCSVLTVVVLDSKVFVGNLPFSATADDISEHFSTVGEVLSVDIPNNPRGQPKGFALLEFNTEEIADNAIAKFNNTDFQGRTIFVKKDEGPRKASASPSRRKQDRPQRPPRENHAAPGEHKASADFPGTQLYVGNVSLSHGLCDFLNFDDFQLPWRTSWQDLKDEFSKFGEVLRANVIKDENGRSRGFGTVRFANEEDALKAIAAMDQQEFNGRNISVRKDRYQEQK
jgi:RNA recognition motif-containing protein